tara:strand:+ start:188 stop:616 length:429 start_codon:yes stop_codon:yes gene_type:complete
MILFLLALIIVIGGYFIYRLTKQINNLKNIITLSIKAQVSENKLYLLDEADNKSSNDLELLSKELENIKRNKQDEFKVYVEDLIKSKYFDNKDMLIRKFDKVSKNVDIKHQQFISEELQKLRSELNKDLENIVDSIRNMKIY